MSSVMCVICQETDAGSDVSSGGGGGGQWASLQCGHVFHLRCVSTWLHRNPSCPQCQGRASQPPMRIYFATTDQEGQGPLVQQGAAAAAEAAAAPEDTTQEMEQLRQLLFNEAQERDAAWKQVSEEEKVTGRLRSDNGQLRRETAGLSRELETCQLAIVQRHEELEMKDRERLALAQQLADSQRLTEQLLDSQDAAQVAIRRLGEEKELLAQRVRLAERQAGELRSQLEAAISGQAGSVAGYQSRQRELQDEAASLETALQGCKWQLEMEQKSQQSTRQQLADSRSRQAQSEQLAEALREQLADSLSRQAQSEQLAEALREQLAKLKQAANLEVNRLKGSSSEAQQQLEAERRAARDQAQTLAQLQQDMAFLQLRLQTSEKRNLELQKRLTDEEQMKQQQQQQQQPGPDSVNYWNRNVRDSTSPQFANPSDCSFLDNFADFPVLDTRFGGAPVPTAPVATGDASRRPPLQQSTPDLRRFSVPMPVPEPTDYANLSQLQQHFKAVSSQRMDQPDLTAPRVPERANSRPRASSVTGAVQLERLKQQQQQQHSPLDAESTKPRKPANGKGRKCTQS